VIAGQREDPDAADPVGRPVLDLGRRQGRVPVPDGGEVPQQGPDLVDRAADHRALRYLWHVSLLNGCVSDGQPRMFTARAMTSAMAATETADWSIIMSFAQRVSGATSPAEKEMAFVNDRCR
jgi:hypothetical protein